MSHGERDAQAGAGHLFRGEGRVTGDFVRTDLEKGAARAGADETYPTEGDASEGIGGTHRTEKDAMPGGARVFRSEGEGLRVFRLDARDFPQAERLTVDAGACGKVVYTLLPAAEGARRLAWRTEAGSVEHYTFPVERTVTVAALRRQIRTAEGAEVAVAASAETTLLLESAYEGRAVLDALAGLLAAPQVWLAAGDDYTPVSVVSEQATVLRDGGTNRFEIAVRPARKASLPWS